MSESNPDQPVDPEAGPPTSESGSGSEETPEPVESEEGVVGDEQLPEDLRPTDDNPLAHPLPEDEEADIELPEPDVGDSDDDDDD